MKQVQIPEKLFMELIKYHLAEIDVDESYIRQELQIKLDALANRQRYSQAMAASSDQNRQELLQVYYSLKQKH